MGWVSLQVSGVTGWVSLQVSGVTGWVSLQVSGVTDWVSLQESVYWYLGRALCDMWVSMDTMCCRRHDVRNVSCGCVVAGVCLLVVPGPRRLCDMWVSMDRCYT